MRLRENPVTLKYLNAGLKILLADDDEDDHFFFKEAIGQESETPVELISAYDGAQALQILFSSASQLPDILVLDLNMPLMDGFSVLRAVRTSAQTSTMPVHVLSTSDDVRDRRKCEQLGCTSYHVKPVNFAQLRSLINGILPELHRH